MKELVRGILHQRGREESEEDSGKKIALQKGRIAEILGARADKVVGQIIAASKPVIGREYTLTQALIDTQGKYLPSWMRKSEQDGSIMVHPGDVCRCGYAITDKGDILAVESVWGYQPEHAGKLNGSAYLAALLDIRSVFGVGRSREKSKE